MKQKKTSRLRPAASSHSRTHNQRLIAGVICIVLAGIVWLAFGQTVQHGFVNYDDGPYVYENPRVVTGLGLSNLAWAFTHVHAANWHPLTTISHMLDAQVYGLQPWGHHLTNVLLHTAAAILLFFALYELSGNGKARPPGAPKTTDGPGVRPYQKLWVSAFVSALFAIHPLRMESVAWVAERKDVLSGVFFALILLTYARYARNNMFSLARYITVLVLFALGLMCKPTLVAVPFVLLLLDYWPLGRISHSFAIAAPVSGAQQRRTATWLQLILEKIPFFILSAASCVVTILAQREALNSVGILSLQERFANAVVAYVKYIGQMIYPAHLAVLYPYPQGGPPVWQVIGALVFLIVVTTVCVIWRKRYPFLLVGWLWFIGMMVPMIGIVQVGSQPMADRYTYLPAIGLYILVTWGAIVSAQHWQYRREALAISGALIIAALTTRSYLQAGYWQNSETLWTRTLDVTHRNYIAHNNLAGVLLDKGQLDDSIAHYREAVDISPVVASVQSNLGNALARKGQLDQAIVELQKAVNIDPQYADGYSYMGSALLKKGQVDEAIRYYQKAIQLNTSDPDSYNNMGIICLRAGQVDQAIDYCRKAVAIKPGSTETHYNLGNAFARKGDWQNAMASYTAALRMERDPIKRARLDNNLGAVLEKLGKLDEALEKFNDALQLNANYPEARCNVARMLARIGRRDEAVAQLNEALRLRPGYEQARKQLQELGVSMP